MKTCIIVNAELPTNNNHKNDTRSGFIAVFGSCCLLFSSNPLTVQSNKVFFTNYLTIKM